ncbi:hypothetical protein ACRE_052880 [Hapsidospora chrysogenum ATCC 11550]|uniref:Uncharacterized protein n=1 Tax=Hapsidospora chrysogenum (strain ATCC 11550 / CBS 779.69 / DSM 880 / IAM 14645 / JCM 23072 / IMI 49137) TaxID=857340 RepID=A0A086T3L3_HAPC1|nr:hypothetical protein ACRE_052880 [Hapsidospora chrysogenum ATCC 11550]
MWLAERPNAGAQQSQHLDALWLNPSCTDWSDESRLAGLSRSGAGGHGSKSDAESLELVGDC